MSMHLPDEPEPLPMIANKACSGCEQCQPENFPPDCNGDPCTCGRDPSIYGIPPDWEPHKAEGLGYHQRSCDYYEGGSCDCGYQNRLEELVHVALEGEAKWRAEHPETDERIEGLTHIEALDQLNDLVAGLELWRESKMHSDYGAWDKHDEGLWRWIEGSEAKDQF